MRNGNHGNKPAWEYNKRKFEHKKFDFDKWFNAVSTFKDSDIVLYDGEPITFGEYKKLRGLNAVV